VVLHHDEEDRLDRVARALALRLVGRRDGGRLSGAIALAADVVARRRGWSLQPIATAAPSTTTRSPRDEVTPWNITLKDAR
jgi:hypothetical protein